MQGGSDDGDNDDGGVMTDIIGRLTARCVIVCDEPINSFLDALIN